MCLPDSSWVFAQNSFVVGALYTPLWTKSLTDSVKTLAFCNNVADGHNDNLTSNHAEHYSNDFNFEESLAGGEYSSALDLTTASYEIIAQLEQRKYDEETIWSRLRQFTDMAEE